MVAVLGDEGEAGSGHDADVEHVGADGGQTGSEGGDEHVPERRVSRPTTTLRPAPSTKWPSPAQVIGERRGQVDVGDTTDAVGAEEAARTSRGSGQGPVAARITAIGAKG